jgi:neutral ceramidase
MMNLRLSAAFAAVTLILLVFLQLLAMVQQTEQIPESSFTRNFNKWKSRASAAAAADNLFLVGAGKADVTGYGISLPP